ncbi:hypothetical protein 101114BS3_123 [Escherichia phage vB_EcoP-101114BS3]|nr:hypothetical protein 101114BS3_123 [Escherichia phage vB_EcoP-101114BS3]
MVSLPINTLPIDITHALFTHVYLTSNIPPVFLLLMLRKDERLDSDVLLRGDNKRANSKGYHSEVSNGNTMQL